MKYLSLLLLLLISIGSCKNNDKGDDQICLNFKLVYNDDPLVMFQEYDYPQGNKIYFSKVSFYLSNLTIWNDDTPSGSQFSITENDLIDLTNSHIDASTAEEGLTLTYDTPTQNIDQVYFQVGLNSIDNATVPTDHTSDNDLSKAGEYWPGWKSYVFVKIEGMIDLDGDGVLEKQVALHLGSDDAQRELITAMLDNQNDLKFKIDLQKVFNQNGNIYDIAGTPAIHTIDDINSGDAINFLADGFIRAFELVN